MRVLVVTSLLVVAGCTVNAPPAEDLSGENLNVQDGKIVLDEERVPVVDECAEGQVVQRTADAWSCVTIEDLAVAAGDGIVTEPGPGAVAVSVDFGPGATQVASGADLAAVAGTATTNASDIDALEGRADAIEALDTTQTARIDALETRPINDLYVASCEAGSAGGIGLVNGALAFCDGTDFRLLEVAPPPAPLLIAAFDRADFDQVGKIWPSTDGSHQIFVFSDVITRAAIDPPGPTDPLGVGRDNNGGGAIGSALGHGRVEVPERDFSIEVTFEGSETIFSLGDLRVSTFGGGGATPEINVTELGRTSRWIDQTPPAAGINRHHLVYVHTSDDDREVYLDGELLGLDVTNPENAVLSGPRLDGARVLELGERFGGAGGNSFIYFNIAVHGHALDQSEVTTACEVQENDNLVPDCPPI